MTQFNDTFTTGSSVDIATYNAQYEYAAGAASNLMVRNPDNDATLGFSSAEVAVRYKGMTAQTDWEVTATMTVRNGECLGPAVRIGTANAYRYQVFVNTANTNEVALNRESSDGETLIGSWDEGLLPGDTVAIRLKCTGISPVAFEVQTAGGTIRTASDAGATRVQAAGYPGIAGFGDGGGTSITAVTFDNLVSAGATLTSPSPLGPIGTTTTATIGGTTNQGTAGSNNMYFVLSTSNVFSGQTVQDCVDGKRHSDGTTTGVTASGAVAVTTTSVTWPRTGLTGSTTYYYAMGQRNANGDSNVIQGSFTTAATVNRGIRITDIYAPNSASIVADATGVDVAVYDAFGGTKLYQGTVNLVGGDCDIDSDSVGALASTPYVLMRWVVSGNEFSYSGTETVIDLDA